MSLLYLTIVLPFVVAVLCLTAGQWPNRARALGIAGAVAQAVVAALLLCEVTLGGVVVAQAGGWPSPFGITLVADMLSALMVAVTALVAVAVGVYALFDIEERLVRRHFFALFHFLLMGVNGAFVTGDLFNLYVWFEVMLLSSFVLMVFGRERGQLEGGVKYLVINLVSSLLFLSGVGLLYGKLGTLNMADIALRLADSPDAWLVNSSGMLLLAAFAIKAALFPFFFWLPASYHTPPVAISALFAGLLTKVGIYALMRAYTLMFSTQFDVVQDVLLLLAGATMVSGVLGAAAQFEVRKILSFHIVSQIGYLAMGLAIGTPLAIAGAIFYTLHHIIVKTNLFLIGGIMQRRAGSGELKKIGGLYRWAPGLALLFFVPAFSLGGIPPLSGFFAKYAVIRAGLEGGHFVLVAAALLVGVLTLYSMTKIWAEAFWKSHPEGEEPERIKPISSNHGRRLLLYGPCVGMALITVGLGLWSGPLFELSQEASAQLLDPRAYIDAVLPAAGVEEVLADHD